jgi:transcriptional regulator with XRE-family HTH domain
MNNLAGSMTWPELIESILTKYRTTTYAIEQEHNISAATLSNIRNSRHKPSPKTVQDLENAFSIKIHDEDPGNIWYEEIHKPTEKQKEIQQIIYKNPVWNEWFNKFDEENRAKISYQIYNAPEIGEELYEGIKELFIIRGPFSIYTKMAEQERKKIYPERIEPHNHKEKNANENGGEYNKQDEILTRIEKIELQLSDKDKRIEELEAAVQVLGAKLGITGTLVQILEAVKSGRLS